MMQKSPNRIDNIFCSVYHRWRWSAVPMATQRRDSTNNSECVLYNVIRTVCRWLRSPQFPYEIHKMREICGYGRQIDRKRLERLFDKVWSCSKLQLPLILAWNAWTMEWNVWHTIENGRDADGRRSESDIWWLLEDFRAQPHAGHGAAMAFTWMNWTFYFMCFASLPQSAPHGCLLLGFGLGFRLGPF